ncbi:Hypothetical predicted protein, partial [Mytilus galloprovincialis]
MLSVASESLILLAPLGLPIMLHRMSKNPMSHLMMAKIKSRNKVMDTIVTVNTEIWSIVENNESANGMTPSDVAAKNLPKDWILGDKNNSKDFLDWNQDNVTISNVLQISIDDIFNDITVPNGREIDGSMELGTPGSNSGNLFDDQNTNMPQCPVLTDILTSVFVFLLENPPNASSIQPGDEDGKMIFNPGDLPDAAIDLPPGVDLPDGAILLPGLVGENGDIPGDVEIYDTAEQTLKNDIFLLSDTCNKIFSRSWVKSLYLFLVTTCIILALAGYIMFILLPMQKKEILSPIFITIRSFMLVASIKVLLFACEGIPGCKIFPFELSTNLQCLFMHIRQYTENLLVTHVCLLSCQSLYRTVFKTGENLNMKVTRISLAFIYIGFAILSMMYAFINIRTCDENLSMTSISDFIFLNALCITLVVPVAIAYATKPLKAFNSSQQGILKTQSRMSLTMMGWYATMYCPCQAMIVGLVVQNCPNEIPLMF